MCLKVINRDETIQVLIPVMVKKLTSPAGDSINPCIVMLNDRGGNVEEEVVP